MRFGALFLVVLSLLLRTGAADAQQTAFQVYASSNGLVSLGTTCVQQDRIGFILVCTDNGVYRFDGHVFTQYGPANGLPERGVSQAARVTADGHLFLIQAGDIFVARDAVGPHFFQVPGLEGIGDDDGTRTATFGNDYLVVSGHTLWIASAAGNPATRLFLPQPLLARFPALRSITSVAARGDIIWLACAGGSLCRLRCRFGPLDPDERRCDDVRVFGPEQGVQPRPWAALLIDRGGTLWARAPDYLLEHSVGQDGFTEIAIPGGAGRFAGRAFRLQIEEDPRGRVVTQGSSGLLIYDHGRWDHLDRMHGLPDGEIAAFTYDRDGSLWLAVRGEGLFRSVGSTDWENWSVNDGLSNDVCWQMGRQAGGPLWVATEDGVNGINETGTHRVVHLPSGGPGYALAVTVGGDVWTADLSGSLRRFVPATGAVDASFRTPIADMISTGKDGSLLLATRDGLYRVADAGAPAPGRPVLIPGTHGHIRTFAEDEAGMIWAVVDDALLRFDPTGREKPALIWRPAARAVRGMVFAAPNELWISSDNEGLQRLRLADGKAVSMTAIDHPSETSQVSDLVRDRRGWVWMGSDHGVDVWNGHDWGEITEQDGLVSNDLDEGAILADPDGTLWFGTGRGLSHLLNPAAIFRRTILHPIITEALLDGAPIETESVPWSHARLTIGFSALDYGLSDTIRFRYRLKGLDKDWVETADTTVRYPALPSGHLVFSVQAIDPAHHLSSAPVSFSLYVRPPWWERWWFRGIAALAVFACAALIWRLRIRLLLARQRHLEELVRMRTAEIAQAHAALEARSARDDLTGLLNRATIMSRLKDILADPSRCERLAVVMADLDHFKSINDRYGHFGGDIVLTTLSQRLACTLGTHELAGRYGGEEFLIVLTGPGNKTARLAEIRNAILAAPIAIEDKEIAVTCSFGLACFRSGDDLESLLRRADLKLYEAKADGRNRIVIDEQARH
ncbi:diguanylate cyclase [Acetobacteraceae bacterium KSS8]|uniref:diguanylate cyclase n=1 Tax=Endosaccharibacter trunci TaxID=2812733 RepID=A0ABT1W797_9PROT|nr:diguanylate cyclase [Acetobacteraceae bacterium KSS8]